MAAEAQLRHEAHQRVQVQLVGRVVEESAKVSDKWLGNNLFVFESLRYITIEILSVKQ